MDYGDIKIQMSPLVNFQVMQEVVN